MAEVSLVIIPALIVGCIIGLVEMMFVHSDEIGMGWFMHGLHAFPFTVLFTFISMNISWALGIMPFSVPGGFFGDFAIRAVIAIIAMLKIQTAAAIAGRVGERFHHTFIIGVLIFLSGYVWPYIAPFVPLPKLPFF